jgi:hypothetical protein
MKNILFRVSLKYGLIFAGLEVLCIPIIRFISSLSDKYISFIINPIMYLILAVLICKAHYEYNKKNKNFISFKEAILVGLIIIAVSFIPVIFVSLYKVVINEVNYVEVLYILIYPLVQIVMLFILITMESQWKIYRKAGKKGWTALVPVYNLIVLLEIVKKPSWWIILLFLLGVNIIISVWMTNLLAKRFGKNEEFTLGLIFLPFIFFPLLGMSKLKYIE